MYIEGWWGVAIFLLGEIIFILLEILNFATLLQPKLKHYSQRWGFSITRKSWFSANCTGKWCPQQVHFLGQLMFYYVNITSTYPTVWKLSRMPSCIPPLFGTRYLSTLNGSGMMFRKTFRKLRCRAFIQKPETKFIYIHRALSLPSWRLNTTVLLLFEIYLDVLRIPIRQ